MSPTISPRSSSLAAKKDFWKLKKTSGKVKEYVRERIRELGLIALKIISGGPHCQDKKLRKLFRLSAGEKRSVEPGERSIGLSTTERPAGFEI
jgi:hypothetical protein